MKIFKCTIWLFLVAPGSVASATQQDIDNARIGGLAYLIAKQGGGGNWKSGDGTSVQTTALVIDAFRNSGITRGEAYGAAAAWLGNSDPVSVDGLARKIIALQAVGRNVEGHVGKLIGWGNSNDRYTWGTYKNYDTGILDTALALSALRVGKGYSVTDQKLVRAIYCEALPAQVDGAWSYIKPMASTPKMTTKGAIVPTAYMLLELLAIKNATHWDVSTCGASSYSIDTASGKAASWLLSKKNAANGGFGDDGVSGILETALVYRALQAQVPTNPALVTAQDYLVIGAGKPLANGSWANDPMQTALALSSLPPVVLADQDRDGVPDAVEARLGTSPAVPDGRPTAPGNGLGVVGVNLAKLLASAALSKPFTYSLTPANPPFHLESGALPEGLALNSSTGVISGTPTRAGVFNFAFTTVVGLTEAQIVITP